MTTKQAIAGVAPAELGEVTVMTVWPSIARYAIGRAMGVLFDIPVGIYVLTIGNLIALASIPIALPLYLSNVAPVLGIRYRLTNRRIIVERGLGRRASRSIDLDRFDAIDLEVGAGQAWYDAGDLVFRNGKVEVFRLEGVSRPAAFRQICLKTWQAHTTVKQARERQPAMA
ncbi:MAG: PH domain-containing protein [Planctomycetota bacterium]